MTQADQAMPQAAQRVAEKLQAWCATLPEEEQEVMGAILRLAAEQGEVTGYVDARVAGAVAAVAMLLGGAGIFGATREATPAQGAASTTISRTAEGVTPRGGLAEQYQEQEGETAAREAARVTTRGGMAEQYAEQAAEAQQTTEQESRPGGLDEVRPISGA